jgi:3-oxoacyl-[acyl-carrier-protein] synthase II
MADRADTIVITGCGVVGPFGVGTERLRDCLMSGAPAVRPLTRYALDGLAGEVEGFQIGAYVKTALAQRAPLISQYAVAASVLAVDQAGAKAKPGVTANPLESAAIVYGTGNGPSASSQAIWEDIFDNGLATVKPRHFQESVFNAPAGLISIHFGIRGPSMVLAAGLAAGLHALKVGADVLRRGEVDMVLVIAAEELAQEAHRAMRSLKLVAPAGEREVARPFDIRHCGSILAEGAGALILERARTAEARGARVLAELAGAALGNCAYRIGPSNPDGSGLVRPIRRALEQAGVTRVDAVFSGSVANAHEDRLEANALRAVFGEAPPPITATRAALGNAQSAGNLFDVAAAIEALRSGVIPPTANHEIPDPDCALDVVHGAAREGILSTILIDAMAMNGAFGAAVLRAWP